MYLGMSICFDVIRANESAYVGVVDGIVTAYSQLNLVMEAEMETMISLSSGKSIYGTQVNFTISTKWKTGKDIDEELSSDEIGFLCHTETNGEPHIHGAALWPLASFPNVADVTKRRHMSIYLSNLGVIPEYAPPFQWGTDRPNVLRIASLEISVA